VLTEENAIEMYLRDITLDINILMRKPADVITCVTKLSIFICCKF